MATYQMFQSNPDDVWQWYLYRLGVCQRAEPNAGHKALVDMERRLEDRFTLITQNVDGLHLRAGSTEPRTYQIHGNIQFMRCAADCSPQLLPIPSSVKPKNKNECLTEADREALRCPHCGNRTRPHILWFDEYYDEAYYRYNSSIHAAENADALLVVGTSGATSLPMQVGSIAARRGALMIDINPASNPFSSIAQQSGGFFIEGTASDVLAEMAMWLAE
jgi:NAD-dependent deacetylase